ncbi:hypothetical protein K402DRAFT_391513 [Aulographum hederae CBS 113979]|uniref:PLC-like phosphodiesterase n=1 Tax=Aulographum hederae CBS 113979 TaxID=1176131 RepID=A0A6G1H718_9PEZI|nr:hypothetical protein K402DRAFT_391513 [Aulographum hederae CBS 113979]
MQIRSFLKHLLLCFILYSIGLAQTVLVGTRVVSGESLPENTALVEKRPLSPSSSSSSPSASPAIRACNNSPSLCNRSYANITHLGAHDSPFISDETTGFSSSGNQYYNTTLQLSAGVRLLSAQLHSKTNSTTKVKEWHLCHSSCALLDAGTLSNWLSEIKTWMDSNPNEVVTLVIVNSNNASADDINTEYRTSGIIQYVYEPPLTRSTTDASKVVAPPMSSWPTLNEMIAEDRRLVTFVANMPSNPDTAPPYILDEFTYVFENPFEVTAASNFSCLPDRPSSVAGKPQEAVDSNRLFLQNHFLDVKQAFGIETPDEAEVATTNSPDTTVPATLGAAAQACKRTYGGRNPNFLLVDFFNVGPAIDTVDQLNGVTAPLGRESISALVQKEVVGSEAARAVGRSGGRGSLLALGVVLAVAAMGLV